MAQENPTQVVRPTRDHWVVRMNHRNRSGSFVLLFAALAAHLVSTESTLIEWLLLGLHFLVYPHLVYWRAHCAPDQMKAELDNLIIDSFLFGMWMAVLHFPVWIVFTLTISTTSNLTVFRGRKGAIQAFGAIFAGIVLTLPLVGVQFVANTNALTTGLCVVGLTLYLLIVANGAYGRAIKLHEAQEKLRAGEQALASANGALQQQLAEIHLLQDKLRQQANHDALTGLYNRHYLDASMGRELDRCKREGQPLSLMMIDIDHFKLINDTYGHQAGDEALRQLAALLRTHARAADLVCRYGGEEFLLVLPGMSHDTAGVRAEAYRHDFEAMTICFGEFRIQATLSIGISCYPGNGTSAEELIKQADLALYQAKAEGRNRVIQARAPSSLA